MAPLTRIPLCLTGILLALSPLLTGGARVCAAEAPPKETMPDATQATAGDTLKLSVEDAVLMALANNVSLHMERLEPTIGKEYEQVEEAVFDPHLNAAVVGRKTTGANEDSTVSAEAGITKQFSSGTSVGVRAAAEEQTTGSLDERSAGLDVELTQALLRGRGRDVNLARLHQAAIDTRLSQYQLRAVSESLVAAVETAYWDCVLAREKIDIYVKSFEVAEQQIAEVREQISVGKVAELDLAAAEAELAEKREQLIAARGDLAKRLLLFRQLVNPDGGQWNRDLLLSATPQQPEIKLDSMENHVQLGLGQRPDLQQAFLHVQRGDLEVVRTRNGLLPRLDLFVRLGGTYYARTFRDMDEDDDLNVAIGLTFDLPVGRREDKARHRIAELSLEQMNLAVLTMRQLVQFDVRTAYVQVGIAKEQIAATAATRKLRQDTLTAEREKFRVGTSTTLQVAQAWRDLIASEINEIEAVISLRKAMIDLYRLEGTLLQRRGIEVAETNGL